MAAQAVRIGTIVVRKKTRARFRSDDKESRARKRMWSPRDSEAAEVRRDGHRKPAEEEVWGLGDAAWRPVSWPEFGQVGGLAVPSASLRSSPNPGIRITRRGKGEGERRGKEKNGKGNAIHGQNVSWAVSWLASEIFVHYNAERKLENHQVHAIRQVASQQKKKTKTQVCPRAGLNRGPHDLISTSHALLRLSYKGLLQVFTIPHSHYFPALVLSKLPEYCYPAEESPQSEQLISASSDPLTTSGDKTIQISRHFSGHGLYRKRSMSRCDGARVEVRTKNMISEAPAPKADIEKSNIKTRSRCLSRGGSQDPARTELYKF
ncbi:predicted protein [Histoplasma capsulatum G186AR]|uniref:Uncharacterized protein n=1 Tax=Ajellomyces capsulatus (strain G186AR / H82 / ATCC MYA-2454 / RMSCC 2432) TaxID=447093 RepID=C0NUB4_AJECG|nr:uncharacterized protein HCBG_06945 [Histoplasma capsulatum G186AR]EEH04994.1 predicted protein [Histoplasma capsulatum G186AR]